MLAAASFIFQVLYFVESVMKRVHLSNERHGGEKCSKRFDLVRIHLRTITRSDRGEKKESVLNFDEISNEQVLLNP